MKDPLFKTAFLVFVLGFSSLVSMFYLYETEFIDIQQLEEGNFTLNDFWFKGEVVKVSETETIAFLTISKQCEIEAMVFKDGEINLSSFEGKKVKAEGHLNEYKGEKGIVLDRVRVG